MHPEALVAVLGYGQIDLLGVHPGPLTPMPDAGAATGSIDEDTAHGLGGGGEEVLTAVPRPAGGRTKPQPGLVNQRRGLQRLPGPFVGHFLSGKTTEFVIHHREQLRGIGLWRLIHRPIRTKG